MDSPIFGNHNNNNNNKSKVISNNRSNNGHSVQFTTTMMMNNNNRVYDSEQPLQWQLAKRVVFNNSSSNNTQWVNDLKLSYVILTMQNNFQTLFYKIAKCLNRKRHQSLYRIFNYSHRQCETIQLLTLLSQQQYAGYLVQNHSSNNQMNLVRICITQTQQKLRSLGQIISRLQLKRLAKGWRRLTIYSDSNSRGLYDHIINGSTILQQSSTLPISSSKLQSKRHLNSKKHARQMKQNSLLNNGKNSEFQSENQRLGQELTVDEINLEKFTAKMNGLLTYHEGLLAGETTERFSEGKDYSQPGGSVYNFENNNVNCQHQQQHNKPIQGTKSQVYTKKK